MEFTLSTSVSSVQAPRMCSQWRSLARHCEEPWAKSKGTKQS